MKKEYKKPELLFDSFELSVSIAAGCENILKAPIYFGGKNIFAAAIECDREPTVGEENLYSGCYHNPDDTQNVFTS